MINIIGNLATVFCDQSYHQRSIASNPAQQLVPSCWEARVVCDPFPILNDYGT